METKDLLIILLPIISAVGGSYLTYYFTRKSRRDEAILRLKEEKYTTLLVLLQGFMGQTASGEMKRKFLEEQYRSWIYASDDVVLMINRMIQHIIDLDGKTPKKGEGQKLVGEIVLAMRKDLLGKTSLSFSNFHYTSVIE